MGLADLCRSRVLQQADMAMTRTNALTSGNLAAAKRPIDLASDAEILDAALALIGQRSPADARILWIRNTLDLDEVLASRAVPGRGGRPARPPGGRRTRSPSASTPTATSPTTSPGPDLGSGGSGGG